MTNKLIKNEAKALYTIEVKDGMWVKCGSFSSGSVSNIEVSTDKDRARYFEQEETAKRVKEYVGGKLFKHTRTTVITEVTEEIKGGN